MKIKRTWFDNLHKLFGEMGFFLARLYKIK